MHPSGTFYFDTLRVSSLFVPLERIWRSHIRNGVFSTCKGYAKCLGGGGLVWILPEQELPKVSLKCYKVC